MTPDLTNINTLWGSILIEELVRHQVTQFVISPGSRSTPLVVSVDRNPLAESVMHFDERGAAYFALGYARATGRPAALICTSGTAVANYLPAVVEASMDCVPMILLTADRPPELRNRGANQTIQQPGIFSSYPRYEFDLPCPGRDNPLSFLLTVVDQAVQKATQTPAGPVHLNCMYREPLVPTSEGDDLSAYASDISTWISSNEPLKRADKTHSSPATTSIDEMVNLISLGTNGLLVVGALKSEAERRAVNELAVHLQWPLLADICSGIRGGETPTRIDYFDLLLSSPRFSSAHQPETVLQIGSRITSKRLLTFLEDASPKTYLQILDHPFVHDPIGRVTHRFESSIVTSCAELGRTQPLHTGISWLKEWKGSSQHAGAILDCALADSRDLTEPLVVHQMTSLLPKDSVIWAASSMPIRDLDMFSNHGARRFAVVSNRGASGIDGTVASAAGYAKGVGRPVTLLIGDLALLHDLTSLSLLKDESIRLRIVVMNNNGGGIFGHLSIASHAKLLDRYFTTPHGYEFAQAAQMFSIPYVRISSRQQLSSQLPDVLSIDGSVLVELPIDRQTNQQFHQNLVQEIVAGLEGM